MMMDPAIKNIIQRASSAALLLEMHLPKAPIIPKLWEAIEKAIEYGETTKVQEVREIGHPDNAPR